MPDWLTHSVIGWITGKVLKKEVGLVAVGSLIPDLVKLNHFPLLFEIDLQSIFNPFHTPIGSLLIAGIFSLFFLETKKVFLVLTLGVTTHFLLDFFVIGATRGIQFLFPLSWEYWRFNEIMVDYRFTGIVVLIGFAMFLYYVFIDLKKKSKKQEL